jgi:uncharacterized protein YndB with AHSA1/START domain
MADETTTQNTGTRDLVVTRVFEAPVEQIWKAWADPEYVKQWWGPDGFSGSVSTFDFREGGTSHVAMSSPDFGTNFSLWEYRTIQPMERIEYVHNLADEAGNRMDPTAVGMPPEFPQDVLNVIAFRDLGDGRTEMTITEYGDYTEHWYNLSKMGLEQCVDKMARAVSS